MCVGELGDLAHISRVAGSRNGRAMGDNRAVAQIEVTEESIRGLVDTEVFAHGAHLVSRVSGLSVSGTLVGAVVDGVRVTARTPPGGPDGQGQCQCPDPAPCAHAVAVL